MTWPVLILTIILSLLKLLVTCLPTDAVNWIMSKFKIHSEISDADAIVTFDGKRLEGEDKVQVLHYFNEAKFLKKKSYISREREFVFTSREQWDSHYNGCKKRKKRC